MPKIKPITFLNNKTRLYTLEIVFRSAVKIGYKIRSKQNRKVCKAAAANGRAKGWKYVLGFAQRPAASYYCFKFMGSVSS